MEENSIKTNYRFSLKSSDGQKTPNTNRIKSAKESSNEPNHVTSGNSRIPSRGVSAGSVRSTYNPKSQSNASVDTRQPPTAGSSSTMRTTNRPGTGTNQLAIRNRLKTAPSSRPATRSLGSASSVNRVTDSNASRVKSAISVSSRRSGTNLSDIYRQHSSIDVKGRPYSAPGTEPAVASRDSRHSNVAINKQTSHPGRQKSVAASALSHARSGKHQGSAKDSIYRPKTPESAVSGPILRPKTRESVASGASIRAKTPKSVASGSTLRPRTGVSTPNSVASPSIQSSVPNDDTKSVNDSGTRFHKLASKTKDPKAPDAKSKSRPLEKQPDSNQNKSTVFDRKQATPFWFYRSKTDALLPPEVTQKTELSDLELEDKHKLLETVINENVNTICSPTHQINTANILTPRNNDNDKTKTNEAGKPKTMIPKIYVFDSFHKQYVPCSNDSPLQTPRTGRSINEPEVEQHHVANDQSEEEIVDLLKRNHRGADSPRQVQVMRTLPLQSDLEKYTWYLQTDKHRDGGFTKSMNRYVPGFFQMRRKTEKAPQVISTNSPGQKVIRSHPKSAPPAAMDSLSVPSAFMTESSDPMTSMTEQTTYSQGMAMDLSA